MSLPDIPSVETEQTYTPHLPSLDVSDELLALIVESPKGDYLTYGATPLDQIATLHQQETIQTELKKLTYRVPDSVPLEIASYVHDTFSKRFQARQEANNENFVTRLVRDYETTLDPPSIEIVDRARIGLASPSELILVRDMLGIRSIELACLTHPYGDRIKEGMLDEMRAVVNTAVELYDGELYENPTRRYRIKDVVGDDDTNLLINGEAPGLLMTRKRTIAQLADGTIIRERSSFVLRIDRASKLRELLSDTEIETLIGIKTLSGDEQESALESYRELIESLLDGNNFLDEAIPISTTIYAFNRETVDKVLARSHQRAIENEHFLVSNNPRVDFTPTEEELIAQAEIDEERSRAMNREAIYQRQRIRTLQELRRTALFMDPRIQSDDEAI